MKTLMPSKTKILIEYSDKTPLLQKYNIDTKLEKMHSPIATLKSGGYIVINQTEALVAVDVNSGKATKERNIEETALQTNKEAAEELAIQLRLRDLSGLIVIDFIDMLLNKNNRIIENILKQRLHSDRAKIQVGNISSFGLLEMSRQRLRPSIYEAEFITCHHCLGHGRVRSLESLTLKALHQIEEESTNYNEKILSINIPEKTAIHILNNKRKELSNIEEKRNITINIIPDPKLKNEEDPLERIKNINKTNNDNKANYYNKNKKEANSIINSKIKRPVTKNKLKKHPTQNNHNQKKLNQKENIDIDTKKIPKKNTKKKIINKTVNKPSSASKLGFKNTVGKNSSNSVSEIKKTSDTKPSRLTPINKKQKTKIVKTKSKGPAKKGWWNKDE